MSAPGSEHHGHLAIQGPQRRRQRVSGSSTRHQLVAVTRLERETGPAIVEKEASRPGTDAASDAVEVGLDK